MRCGWPGGCVAEATHVVVDPFDGFAIPSCDAHWVGLVDALHDLGAVVGPCWCPRCLAGG